MDGDFPWILGAALLLWLFNLIGGRKGTKVERPQQPGVPRTPRPAPPRAEAGSRRPDATQTEGGQLDELLRALERRLDPTTQPAPSKPARSQTRRGPLGRPASVPLPTAEEVEERESLESEPVVVESLEGEVRRPVRVTRDWLAQAEAREQARQAQVQARDDERHKSRHASFDKRIRAQPVTAAPARRLTTAQMRQAFIWGEILGRPKGDW
ncbi:MAG: hypothetical protein ACREOC_06605 [Gemmatimonadales bacterium]